MNVKGVIINGFQEKMSIQDYALIVSQLIGIEQERARKNNFFIQSR